MNYLVTGGAGFIGSTYVRMLLSDQLGPVKSVKVLDKLTYAGSLENLSSVIDDPRFTFIHGDICDEKVVSACVEEGDLVIHFAAESHVDRSIEEPSEFMRTNVLGTQVLLSSTLANKARLFLHVSTDEVYGSIDVGSSSETDPLLPNSPYSASKAASDLVVRSYWKTYGLDARITRCCNNFGPNQFPEKFIPLAINNLLAEKKISVYGDGKNVREWIHVEDHCRGIQHVIDFGTAGEIYNIGSSIELSNLELAELIIKYADKTLESIEFVTDRMGHDYRYRLDSSLIESQLGFRTIHSFQESLMSLVKSTMKKSS